MSADRWAWAGVDQCDKRALWCKAIGDAAAALRPAPKLLAGRTCGAPRKLLRDWNVRVRGTCLCPSLCGDIGCRLALRPKLDWQESEGWAVRLSASHILPSNNLNPCVSNGR